MKEDGQAVTDGYLGTIDNFLIVSGLSRTGGQGLGADEQSVNELVIHSVSNL